MEKFKKIIEMYIEKNMSVLNENWKKMREIGIEKNMNV